MGKIKVISSKGKHSQLIEEATKRNEDNAINSQGRARRRPKYLYDCVIGEEEEYLDNELHNLAIFGPSEDPITYEEAIWRKAMETATGAIEKQKTWRLISLPSGAKTIGVKWVYKTKFNGEGKIDKHMARLIVKGYSQQYGNVCPLLL